MLNANGLPENPDRLIINGNITEMSEEKDARSSISSYDDNSLRKRSKCVTTQINEQKTDHEDFAEL